MILVLAVGNSVGNKKFKEVLEMPILKRFKTKYPGVFFIEGSSIVGKPEKIYYIRYRKSGKMIITAK